MQLTINIPDNLASQLKQLPDSEHFVTKILEMALSLLELGKKQAITPPDADHWKNDWMLACGIWSDHKTIMEDLEKSRSEWDQRAGLSLS